MGDAPFPIEDKDVSTVEGRRPASAQHKVTKSETALDLT